MRIINQTNKFIKTNTQKDFGFFYLIVLKIVVYYNNKGISNEEKRLLC